MRKLFRVINLFSKAFTRRRLWMTLLIIGVALTIGFYYYVYRLPGDAYLALHMTAYNQALLTLVFMLMGIELKREQQRERIEDLAVTLSGGTRLFAWGQVLTLGFAAFAVTLAIMIGCMLRIIPSGAPALWVGQTLAYTTLLYFLPCWTLGLWGLSVAQWNKGKSAYIPAMLGWFLTSTLSADLFSFMHMTGLGGNRFWGNLFNMGINTFRSAYNFTTGVPIELPRWMARIGVLVLLVALFIADSMRRGAASKTQKRYGWIGVCCTLACGLCMTGFFYQRYHTFFTYFASPGTVIDDVWEKHQEYLPGQPVSLTDYPTQKVITPLKTDIDFRSGTQGITVKVMMEAVMAQEASGQAFTLYSGLLIDGVQVDGQDVTFERSQDGCMVFFPQAKKAGDRVTFTFRYHGYSLPAFPANETTVQLNRGFPWIPWPGIKTMSVYSNYYDYTMSEDFFIEDWQRGDKVAYTLRYSGPGHLYTNLEEQNSGLYAGTSINGVALYSGMIKYQSRGTEVYVPANYYQLADTAADAILDAYEPLLDFCKYMGVPHIPQRPKSIVVIQVNMPVIGNTQELYDWDGQWEIRQENGSNAAILSGRLKYGDSEQDYQSERVVTKVAIPYILSPSAGFPINGSHAAVYFFSEWIGAYKNAGNWDSDDIEYYKEKLGADAFDGESNADFISNQPVKNVPLSEQERPWFDKVLERMYDGENFDEPFRVLYQRLLKGEGLTIPQIVSELYHYQSK